MACDPTHARIAPKGSAVFRYALLILPLLLCGTNALAMRCGNRVIAAGAQDFQVRAQCGEPFWTDRYVNIEVIGARGPLERQREVQFDVWYYNFGPRQLLRTLLFRDGIVLREDTLGYGVAEIGTDCNPRSSYAGVSAGELVAHCGEPASRRSRTDMLVNRPRPGLELWRDQRREDWVYDFGDRHPLRILQLIDGRVSGVDIVPR